MPPTAQLFDVDKGSARGGATGTVIAAAAVVVVGRSAIAGNPLGEPLGNFVPVDVVEWEL